MKTTGRITNINRRSVTLELDSMNGIDGLNEVDITIVRHRQKRSLNANSYYFTLANKIASSMNIGIAEYHNRTLAELGIPWLDEDDNKIFVLMRDDDRWKRAIPGENHYCPTARTMTDKNGDEWRWFYLLKPSRFMDTKEMAILIDYVVEDAKAIGIDTKDDKEIARMLENYERIHQTT